MRSRVDEYRNVTRLFAAESYNECEGNPFKARKVFRQKAKAYGLDPMTIILLIQIAIKIWAWAKEQGFLAQMPVVAAVGEPSWFDVSYEDMQDDE